MKNNRAIKAGIAVFLVLIPVFTFILFIIFGENHFQVPIFYPKGVTAEGDSIYHQVPNFTFLDQEGNEVNQDFVENKLYVADYFFTTCLGPCPKMSSQMQLLQKQLKDEERVVLLSHTVDPSNDTVNVLKEYADVYDVDYNKWRLLTGDKKELYDLARYGYLLVANEGDGGERDFIHSQKFVLVDHKRRIRGYYDGTNLEEMKRLLDEIAIILTEELTNEK